MKHPFRKHLFYTVFLVLSVTVSSGPLKTVPWNGHKGAVSFTFDDALNSQLKNVMPALKDRDIHATFFVVGNWVKDNLSPWIQAARDGNEIASHSATHADLTKSDQNSLVREIVEQAKAFRNADTSIECVTIAYPYCARNDAVDAVAKTEHIIGRACSFVNFSSALFDWNKVPDNWMSMGAAYIASQDDYMTAVNAIDEAAKSNTWFVTLHHGVGGDYISIGTDSLITLFDQAIKNKLWIDTYQKVAAYWRASFTMDTVNAVSNGSGWNLSWKSPHPRMPKSVPLLVTFDKTFFGNTFYVYQNGKEISPREDGSYPIEFMDMQLTVSTTCTPTDIIPYMQIDDGVWQEKSSDTINPGQTITFGPNPISDGLWSWSGPNGYSASTREIIIPNISKSQAGNYIVTYAKSPGCNSKMTFTVSLRENTAVAKLRSSFGTSKVYSIENTHHGLLLKLHEFNGNAEVMIYSLKGTPVYRNTFSTNEIHVSGLSKGVYIIKIRQDNALFSEKFVAK